MKHRTFLLSVILLLASIGRLYAQPKLIVGIVIDQMRYDYLTRYGNQYSTGGFQRFFVQGFVYQNHNYNYVPTVTGCGHASIYTGTTPAINGIIGNEWYDKVTKKDVYCAEDNSVQPIGTDSKDSKRSPVLMLTTTIGDQLRFHTAMQSKVIGISIKDRGAILPAGHRASAAYWYDAASGNFVTSSYYETALPEWVQDFNNKKLAEKYLDQTWDLLRPASQYAEPDDLPYEKPYKGLTRSVFPYDLHKLRADNGLGLIASTPFGNTLLADFAIATIEGEHLGQNTVPDMLAISFSSPDYMGHQFGPQSREIHDMYLRLDLELKRLFDYLDKTIGMNNVVVFLTADHGVADIPLYEQSNTSYYSENKIKSQLNQALKSQFGIDSIIENVSNLQIFLDHSLISDKKIPEAALLQICKDNLNALQGISAVIGSGELGSYPLPAIQTELLRNGYNPKRSGDILLIAQPGWISDYAIKGGTTHGSLYTYDTHVPMLWMGWHIPKGMSYQRTETPDIAVTLASLIGCIAPNGATGMPMYQLLDSSAGRSAGISVTKSAKP